MKLYNPKEEIQCLLLNFQIFSYCDFLILLPDQADRSLQVNTKVKAWTWIATNKNMYHKPATGYPCKNIHSIISCWEITKWKTHDDAYIPATWECHQNHQQNRRSKSQRSASWHKSILGQLKRHSCRQSTSEMWWNQE